MADMNLDAEIIYINGCQDLYLDQKPYPILKPITATGMPASDSGTLYNYSGSPPNPHYSAYLRSGVAFE